VSTPRFSRPSVGWFLLLDGGLLLLALLAFVRPAHRKVTEAVPLPEADALKRLLAAAAVVHVGEGAYAAQLARRHDLPVGRWTAQSLVVGFPSLRKLRATAKAVAEV
jgi:hypothetical protein